MSNTKRSVLKAIMESIYASKSFEDGLNVLKECLNDPHCVIRDSEARMITLKATQCAPSLPRLQQYLTNSWLKYEGMGL